MKKYGKNEVKNLELTIRGAGKENLYYLFGDDLINYEGDSYFLDVADKRIKSLNLGRNVRKDAIYLVDVLVSADKEFFEGLKVGEEKQFFHDCFIALSDFFNSGDSQLRSTYPNENVVSAVVVQGENPCMHFSFVPVTTEGKLSAKKIINTKMLFSLRKHLFETVWEGLGLIENSKTELEKIKDENLFLKFDLDLIRNEKDPIRNENTPETENQECLMVTLKDLKNDSDQLKRLNEEFRQISIENSLLRDENIEQVFEIGDLRDENKKLQERVKTLETEKSQTESGQDNLEMKSNVSPFDPKSWTVIMMQELTLLRLSFDFLLRKYVGGMAGIDALPDSAGKEKLKELRKHYEMRGGKS